MLSGFKGEVHLLGIQVCTCAYVRVYTVVCVCARARGSPQKKTTTMIFKLKTATGVGKQPDDAAETLKLPTLAAPALPWSRALIGGVGFEGWGLRFGV